MSRIIEIIVSPQGESRVETTGFAGAECQQASQFVEEALGNRAVERFTNEWYQRSPEEVQQGLVE